MLSTYNQYKIINNVFLCFFTPRLLNLVFHIRDLSKLITFVGFYNHMRPVIIVLDRRGTKELF